MTTLTTTPPSFWAEPLAAVLDDLHTSGEGLSSGEAELRLRRDGPNELARTSRWTVAGQTFRHLSNPLTMILLIASAISAALGEVVDAKIIALIVLFSAAVDLFQARRLASSRGRAPSQGRAAELCLDPVAWFR